MSQSLTEKYGWECPDCGIIVAQYIRGTPHTVAMVCCVCGTEMESRKTNKEEA